MHRGAFLLLFAPLLLGAKVSSLTEDLQEALEEPPLLLPEARDHDHDGAVKFLAPEEESGEDAVSSSAVDEGELDEIMSMMVGPSPLDLDGADDDDQVYSPTPVNEEQPHVTEATPEPALVPEESVAAEDAAGNDTTAGNGTAAADKPASPAPKKIQCLPASSEKDAAEHTVSVVNATSLQRALSELVDPGVANRTQPARCALVLFYASWCPFSAAAAPHFNALGRLYPQLTLLAVDSWLHHHLHTQYGVMALPSVLLFHNGKSVARFNESTPDLERLGRYLRQAAALEPVGQLNLTETDYEGPVPTRAVAQTDYYLYLAWAFTVLCGLGYFGKSATCQRIVEAVRNAWRLAEIQLEHEHEHMD